MVADAPTLFRWGSLTVMIVNFDDCVSIREQGTFAPLCTYVLPIRRPPGDPALRTELGMQLKSTVSINDTTGQFSSSSTAIKANVAAAVAT